MSVKLGLFLVVLTLATTAAPASAAGGAPDVLIAGNSFVDYAGHPLRLIGVNAGPDLSDACVQPVYDKYRRGGVFGGPVDDRAIEAIRSWHANAVRLTLNEDCWLGLNPVRRGGTRISFVTRGRVSAGAAVAARYRAAVTDYVKRLHADGFVVIVDLHWSAPGDTLAFNQWPLPDASHSPAFWTSVATTFKSDPSVVFELFNEPFRSPASALTWRCLRDGCRQPNACADCRDGVIPRGDVTPGCGMRCPTPHHRRGTYATAGMQSLVNAVRATGAINPLLVPGRYYSNDLGQWLDFVPRDPLAQIGATFHAYEGLPCQDTGCWDSTVATVAARVPVVATEFGPDVQGKHRPCDASFDNRFMDWADAHGVSYLAWFFAVDVDHGPADCSQGLINDWYTAAPRAGHGQAVHDHLAALPVP